MGLRVKDGGESESLPVMGRIGVEPGNDAVRAVDGLDYPTRKRADFQTGRSSRESLANHFQEGKQMTAGIVLAGAPSSVTKVHAMAPSVYREGDRGKEMKSPDPLVQRQALAVRRVTGLTVLKPRPTTGR